MIALYDMEKIMKIRSSWKAALLCGILLLFAIPCHAAYDVTLAWDANLEPDLAGYKLYYKTGSPGSSYTNGTGADQGDSPITIGTGNPDDPKNPTIILSDPDNPQFSLTGLSDYEIYFFVVTAYDTDNLESGYSNVETNDQDADGMADNWETLKGVYNPDDDPDGDELTNREEFENRTEPSDSDTDNDDMPDGWEVYYGLDPLGNDAAVDSDGDGLSNVEEYNAGRHPTNCEPDPPVLSSPSDGDLGLPLTLTLETEPFNDFEGCLSPENPDNAHAETEWQMSTSDNFPDADLVLHVTSDRALTALTVPDFLLSPNTTYYWRARFHDDGGAASEWPDSSFTSSFTTVISDDADSDPENGIPDDQEVDDPTMDLDDDGTFDINQGDMKCVNTVTGGGQVGVKAGTNVVSVDAVKSVDPSTIPPTPGAPDEFVLGLISFKVTTANAGDVAQVTLYFSEPIPTGARFFKYDSIKGLREYPFAAFGNTAAGNAYVTLQLRDGDPDFGDVDGLENRIIIDPGGVGVGAPAAAVQPAASGGGGGGGGGCFISALQK
jgi:hypothetical protein